MNVQQAAFCQACYFFPVSRFPTKAATKLTPAPRLNRRVMQAVGSRLAQRYAVASLLLSLDTP